MSHPIIQEKLNRLLAYLAQDEHNLMLLIEISNLYVELKDLELAQQYLNKAKLINDEACKGHQGLINLNLGLFDEAKLNFQEALNLSDTVALRYNLGFTCFITDELDEAWNTLAPILNENLHHPEAELLMSRICHRKNDLEQAASLAENVLANNENDAEALGLLSLIYLDLNEDELAAQTSHRTLALDKNNYDAQIVSLMLRLETQDTSINEIEQLLEINPEDSRLWFALGATHMIEGNLTAAEQALIKTTEIHPEFYDALISLAWCQLLNNHLDKAHETYQNAITRVDELADAWAGLALIYVLTEDFIKAEQLITKANELNPDCFLTEIAETIYLTYKNPEKAKSHLLKTLKDSKIPVSEKLLFILEDIKESEQLH
ncbi:MAG: hypothetical protein Q8M40_06570 [Legionella sp.]|nr:hypothetical protein [Legionella sp.]